MFCNEAWLAQRADLITQNEHSKDLSNERGSMISGTLQQFLSADSVDDAEINKLKYLVELLSSMACTLSLPGRTLGLRKGYAAMLPRIFEPKNGRVNRFQIIVESVTNTSRFCKLHQVATIIKDLCFQIHRADLEMTTFLYKVLLGPGFLFKSDLQSQPATLRFKILVAELNLI